MSGSIDVFTSNLRQLPAFRALLRAVEAQFYAGIELPAPTLDVGCGDGHFVSSAFDSPLTVGMDSDLDLVRKTFARNGVYHGLIQAEAGKLPFADGVFGSAISNSVLEHIPEIENALEEISRVLRPGAPFVFTVPSEFFCGFLSVSGVLSKLGLRAIARAYKHLFNRISRHQHYQTLQEWCALLEQAGMRLVQHRYYFSVQALRALEWGHYFGLPALVAKGLTGRWILSPTDTNLWITERLLRRYYEEPLPQRGAYLFILARRLCE